MTTAMNLDPFRQLRTTFQKLRRRPSAITASLSCCSCSRKITSRPAVRSRPDYRGEITVVYAPRKRRDGPASVRPAAARLSVPSGRTRRMAVRPTSRGSGF